MMVIRYILLGMLLCAIAWRFNHTSQRIQDINRWQDEAYSTIQTLHQRIDRLEEQWHIHLGEQYNPSVGDIHFPLWRDL